MIENSMVRNLPDDPIMNEPEYAECPNCLGTGIAEGWKNITGRLVKQDCKKCNGTGRIPKVKFTIEEG